MATSRVGSLTLPDKTADWAAQAGVGDYSHIRGLAAATTAAAATPTAGPKSDYHEAIERDILPPDRAGGVTFDDIVGLELAKKSLNEAVVLPLIMPEWFEGSVRRPWKGVLLFGPPGTGKTMLAKAVASMNGTTFLNVSAASLLQRYWGESEKVVRALFEVARARAPTVIFIDEVDALMSSRGGGDGGGGGDESSRRLKTEVLKQMDGIESCAAPAAPPPPPPGQDDAGDAAAAAAPPAAGSKLVMVMAASNCPWDLDEAFRRRLEKRVYVEEGAAAAIPCCRCAPTTTATAAITLYSHYYRRQLTRLASLQVLRAPRGGGAAGHGRAQYGRRGGGRGRRPRRRGRGHGGVLGR